MDLQPAQEINSQDEVAKPSSPSIKFLLVVLSILVLLLVLVFLFQKTKSVPQETAQNEQPTEQIANLYSADGRVLSIDGGKNILVVDSTTPNLQVTWTFKIGAETILATFEDWSSTNAMYSTIEPIQRIEIVKSNIKRLALSDFKIGDSVYIIAAENQDLARDYTIDSPTGILIQ